MQLIDLSLLNLTTPKLSASGGATTYPPGQFVEDAFYSQGGQGELRLWAPVDGASTKSTTRTRTEFREVNALGKTFNWLMGSAEHHWLQTSVVVDEVPLPAGETVLSQIHVKDNPRPMLKVSYDNGRIIAGFREDFNQVDPVDVRILDNVPLHTRIALSIHLTASGSLTLSASYTLAGLRIARTLQQRTMPSWSQQLLYFKFGVYNQQSPDPDVPNLTGSRAVYWKASIRHE